MEPDLDSAIAMIEDDPPVIDVAPTLDVTLPGGYIDDDGSVHTDARVRELNGADEEALDGVFKGRSKINVFDRYDTLLLRGVERIGHLTGEDITRQVIRRLLIGDRDHLVVEIRKATYGPEISGPVVCPTCGETSDVTIDLDDPEDLKRVELEDNKRVFTVPLRNDHTAEVRLANGEDQHALGADNTRTVAETNSLLLARCVISLDGADVADNVLEPMDLIREMGAADRRTILQFLVDTQPGPKLREVRVPSASCGVEIDTPVDLDTLLR